MPEKLSPKIFTFGIKAVVPYDRETKKPLGFAEVVSTGGIDLTGEMVSLQGGSNRYSYETAHGFIEPKINVTVKEFPSWIYNLLLGVDTKIEDSSTGQILNIENAKGTTFAVGGNIFTGVTVSEEGNLKFGRFTVEVASASTVNIFASSDVDAGVGSEALTLFRDDLRINQEPLEFKDSTPIPVPQLGVSITVGSDISDANIGDTFTFDIFPKASYTRTMTLGKNTDTFPVFGMYFISEKTDGSALRMIDAFKCKANGFPQTLSEKAWGESELSIMPTIDGANGVCKIIDIIR